MVMSGLNPSATRWAPTNCPNVSAVKLAARPMRRLGDSPEVFRSTWYRLHADLATTQDGLAPSCVRGPSDISHSLAGQYFLHQPHAAHGRNFFCREPDVEFVLDR